MEWLILLFLGWIIVVAIKKNSSKSVSKVVDDSFDEAADDIDEEMDFVDFKITVETSGVRSESKNKNPGRWVEPEEIFEVAGIRVGGGLFYAGGRLKAVDGYNTESSLVDPTLPVDIKSSDYLGEHMGYWPSYDSISPKSRAAYIEWLASNRSDPDCYIGYVFLYFYGIERRLLVEGEQLCQAERLGLVKEVSRLLNVYESNRSFSRYASDLLSYVWLHYDKGHSPAESQLIGRRQFTSIFKYQLAKTVDAGNPISPELAFAWICSHPDVNLRTPARRCPHQFNQLFKIRFKEKYGEGFVVKPNKTKLQIEYYPASSTLRGIKPLMFDLPDPVYLKGPLNKIIPIAESCISELDAYSRFIGKPESSIESLQATVLLPSTLIESTHHKKFNQFKNWLSRQLSENSGLVRVSELFEQLGEDAPLKLNKKESEFLSSLFAKAGFGLAPDIRFHHAKLELGGHLVIFDGGHGTEFKPSHAFNQVGTILRLGAMVANIDGYIDPSEQVLLSGVIDQDEQLTGMEKKSLRAYLLWRLNTSSSMAGLKTRLQAINEREKAAVSHILIGVALADGKVEASEIKQLEKLYTSLGLDKALVSSDIHHLSTGKAPVRQSSSGRPGNIESGEESEGAATVGGFVLNRELLKMHEEETQDVQAVLESIFVNEGEITSEFSEPDIVESTNARDLPLLDKSHTALYQELVTKDEWLIGDVKSLCENLNLMVSGALEVINEWTFDVVDAPIVEEGDTIFVDLEVAEEIAQL